jgi:ribosomal protein L16 Arg81 hydroxylase
LGPHHDETEIFTLQIAGRKRWRLYHRNTRVDGAAVYDPAEIGEAACELTLMPGDLLYTPRGLIHDVGAEAASFSITIVFDPFTWRSLLDVLSVRLAATETFQETLPAGAIVGDVAPDALEPEFRSRVEMIRQALDTLTAGELLDTLAEKFTSRMTWAPGTAQMAAVLDAEMIALDTVVERNPNVACHLARHGDRVQLTLAGGYTIQASARVEPALRAVLLASTPFAVADIHESLADAAKLAIAKKLVGCGVLRPLARQAV